MGRCTSLVGRDFGDFSGWVAELEDCSGRRDGVNCYIEISFENLGSHKKPAYECLLQQLYYDLQKMEVTKDVFQ